MLAFWGALKLANRRRQYTCTNLQQSNLIIILKRHRKGGEGVRRPGVGRVFLYGGEELSGPNGARSLATGHMHRASQSQNQNTIQLL